MNHTDTFRRPIRDAYPHISVWCPPSFFLEEKPETSAAVEDPTNDPDEMAVEDLPPVEPEEEAPAEPVITLSEKEFEQEKARVYQQGLMEGKQQGLQISERQIGPTIQYLKTICNEVINTRTGFFREAESLVVKLALEIARKIIQREPYTELALRVVSKALTYVVDNDRLVVRVHPSDYEDLRAHREELTALIDGGGRLEFEVDSSMQPGGCIIETASGAIDARLGSQLAEIEKALAEELDYGT